MGLFDKDHKKEVHNEDSAKIQKMTEALVSVVAESWRFRRSFTKMMSKMDVSDAERFSHQYNWFQRNVDSAMKTAGLTCQDLTGMKYDVGMAVQPMNLDEFEENDVLYISQMIEPVILADGRVMKMGVVMLTRVDE